MALKLRRAEEKIHSTIYARRQLQALVRQLHSSSRDGARCQCPVGSVRQARQPRGRSESSPTLGSRSRTVASPTTRPSASSLVVPQRNCHIPSAASCVTSMIGRRRSSTLTVVIDAVLGGS